MNMINKTKIKKTLFNFLGYNSFRFNSKNQLCIQGIIPEKAIDLKHYNENEIMEQVQDFKDNNFENRLNLNDKDNPDSNLIVSNDIKTDLWRKFFQSSGSIIPAKFRALKNEYDYNLECFIQDLGEGFSVSEKIISLNFFSESDQYDYYFNSFIESLNLNDELLLSKYRLLLTIETLSKRENNIFKHNLTKYNEIIRSISLYFRIFYIKLSFEEKIYYLHCFTEMNNFDYFCLNDIFKNREKLIELLDVNYYTVYFQKKVRLDLCIIKILSLIIKTNQAIDKNFVDSDLQEFINKIMENINKKINNKGLDIIELREIYSPMKILLSCLAFDDCRNRIFELNDNILHKILAELESFDQGYNFDKIPIFSDACSSLLAKFEKNSFTLQIFEKCFKNLCLMINRKVLNRLNDFNPQEDKFNILKNHFHRIIVENLSEISYRHNIYSESLIRIILTSFVIDIDLKNILILPNLNIELIQSTQITKKELSNFYIYLENLKALTSKELFNTCEKLVAPKEYTVTKANFQGQNIKMNFNLNYENVKNEDFELLCLEELKVENSFFLKNFMMILEKSMNRVQYFHEFNSIPFKHSSQVYITEQMFNNFNEILCNFVALIRLGLLNQKALKEFFISLKLVVVNINYPLLLKLLLQNFEILKKLYFSLYFINNPIPYNEYLKSFEEVEWKFINNNQEIKDSLIKKFKDIKQKLELNENEGKKMIELMRSRNSLDKDLNVEIPEFFNENTIINKKNVDYSEQINLMKNTYEGFNDIFKDLALISECMNKFILERSESDLKEFLNQRNSKSYDEKIVLSNEKIGILNEKTILESPAFYEFCSEYLTFIPNISKLSKLNSIKNLIFKVPCFPYIADFSYSENGQTTYILNETKSFMRYSNYQNLDQADMICYLKSKGNEVQLS